jgi:hypothetical protein
MIRTGIYSLDQLDKVSLKDIFRKEKNISVYLYQKVSKIENNENKVLLAELILNRFNSDRNVIKRTYKNRFNNFDNLSIRKISDQNFDNISILDIAVSDGRASCFFLEGLINQFENFCYTGSDIHLNYFLSKKHEKSKSYIITDENKKVVEITKPPFVWNLARTEGRFYFINNFLKKHFLKRAQLALLKDEFSYQEKLDLLHPDFKALISHSNCFRIMNYNLFDPVPEKYNVIRAMNILHPGYFSKDQLYMIFRNLHYGLEINGLLIEGSNENAGTPVDGAIYKKDKNGFTLYSEPERPSRIKELILAFRQNIPDE